MIIQEIEKKEKSWAKISLAKYLLTCRWFAHKNKQIKEVKINDSFEIIKFQAALLLLEVCFVDSSTESYWLPICYLNEKLRDNHPESIIDETFADAIFSEEFQQALLKILSEGQTIHSTKGQLKVNAGKLSKKINLVKNSKSNFFRSEQSNSAVIYEDKLFLKLYRQASNGTNPECEQIQFLSEESDFKAIPQFYASLEYSGGSSEERKGSVCILLNYIENKGNAWDLTLKAIDESVQLLKTNNKLSEAMTKTNFLQQVKNLAELTADLHIALSSQPINEDFQVIKSIQSNCVEEAKTTFEEIKASRNLNKNNVLLEELLSKEAEMMGFLKNNFPQEPSLKLIHPHGDYHLGQILFSKANGFTIIDFEGEPGKKKINSDCQKNTVHSGQTGLALEDVAGMLRSFSYAINFYQIQNPHSAELINQIKNEWYKTVSKEFMESYFHKTASCNFIPQDKEKRERLLKCLILRKALYEVKYELNNRPDWLFIPINGALELIKNDF